MQTELVQLLQHEDVNNVKLGCILARAAGYSDVEIVDNLFIPDNDYSGVIFIKEWQYLFTILKRIIYCKRYDKTVYEFQIYDFNSDINGNDKFDSVLPKHFNKTKAEHARHFIDMIINR